MRDIHYLCHILQQSTIFARTQATIKFGCQCNELMTIETHLKIVERQWSIATRSPMEIYLKIQLTRKKCDSLTNPDDYICRFIHPGCLKVLTHTLGTICRLQHLTTASKHPSCLGLGNVSCGLVPSFARLVASLNQKLLKSTAYH